jgi:tetratricopeptide (TPR) repeat protein
VGDLSSIDNAELQLRFIQLLDFTDDAQFEIREELKRRGLDSEVSLTGFVGELHDDMLKKIAGRLDCCSVEIRTIICNEIKSNREKLLKHFRQFPEQYQVAIKILGINPPKLTNIPGKRVTPELLDRPPCRFLTQLLRGEIRIQQPYFMRSLYTFIGFGVGYFLFTLFTKSSWYQIGGGGLGAGVGTLISWARYYAVRRKAVTYWNELLNADPDNVDALIQRAMWLQGTEEGHFVDEAKDLLKDVLRKVPGHRDAILMLAMGLMNSNDPHAAASLLRPWLEENSDFYGEAIFAEALEKAGSFSEAVYHYKHIVNSLPDGDEKKRIDVFLRKHGA